MVLTQFTMRNSYWFLFELKKVVVLLGMMQDNLQHHLLTSLMDTRIVVHCNIDTFVPYIVVFLHLLLSVVVSLVQSPTYLLNPFSLVTSFQGIGMEEISVGGNSPKQTCWSGVRPGTKLWPDAKPWPGTKPSEEPGGTACFMMGVAAG